MVNTFDALMAEVNQRISQSGVAASQANAAAAQANAATEDAQERAQEAAQAAQAARQATQTAQDEADRWENTTVQAQTGEALSEASVTMTKEDGVQNLSFVIPRGEAGAQGPKGDPGRSGVTFSLNGTRLYITTE